MNNNIYILLLIIPLIIQCRSSNEEKIALPKKIVIDDYFSQKIEDPYRYMENNNDSLVSTWYKDQSKHSENVISEITGRELFFNNLNDSKKSEQIKINKLKVTNNNLFFYLKRNPFENIAKLYYRDGFSGLEVFLFNPEEFNPKLHYIINYIQPSIDGSRILISLSKNDEEISQMIIFDVATKKIHSNIIDHCWPSALSGVSWLPDSSGFIYSHIPVTNSNSSNYILNTASVLYKIGQNPTKYNVLLSKENNPSLNITPEDFPFVVLKGSKKYLFGRIAGARNYDDYYISTNINYTKIDWKTLYKKEDKIKTFLIDNDSIIFLSGKNAPNFKICKTSIIKPNFETPEILVEEDINAVITDFTLTKNGLFYVKTKNGVKASLFHLNKNKATNLLDIPKPSGKIRLFSKNTNYEDLWIEIEGWTHKTERYFLNTKNNSFVDANLYPVNTYSALKDVVIKEIEVTSHDGTMVPLSIIYKKGTKFNGQNRLLMTGYGAYGISETPYLDKYMLHWVTNGGIYASAHVRGGGDKGDAWHKGGYKLTKPNTWKDFIACTEYLIKEKYSSPDKIAIWSGSAGGILIGRAITERPDLYAAVVVKVGMLNAIRTETAPNGLNNTKEFGSVKDSLEFEGLLEMDAYHHIKKGRKYPAVYLTTGLNDARGALWESGKFAARMQEATVSERPVLLSVDFNGGHGFDASVNKKNKELADVLSFLLWQTGHPDYQPKK
jgi:prolyl oligopeptidase